MTDVKRTRLGTSYQKPSAKEEKPPKDYDEQQAFDDIHSLLMQVKISHYDTRSYSAHKALNKTYDALDELVDSISEQIIGYTGNRPTNLSLGTLNPLSCVDLGNMIIANACSLCQWANAKGYPNIENLAQELSGVGAQLKYLASLT